MKMKYILLSLLAFTTIVFASVIMPPYDNSKPPTLSLPAAYNLAIAAIGSATNQFHCTSASITTDFYAPAWSFNFYSTNTPPKHKCFVVVFDGKVIEDNGLR